MSPGDRPDLPLAAEPATILRAATVGEPEPGPVQPVDHEPGLEEEPALRFEVTGHLHAAGSRDTTPRPDPASTTAPGGASGRGLPTTGPRLPVRAALGAMGLAWILRRRSSVS